MNCSLGSVNSIYCLPLLPFIFKTTTRKQPSFDVAFRLLKDESQLFREQLSSGWGGRMVCASKLFTFLLFLALNSHWLLMWPTMMMMLLLVKDIRMLLFASSCGKSIIFIVVLVGWLVEEGVERCSYFIWKFGNWLFCIRK